MAVADELVLKIDSNVSGALAGMKKVEGKATSMGKKLGAGAAKWGKRIGAAGVIAGVAVAGASMKMAGSFETAMAQIEANVGTSGEDLQKLADAALSMGKDFGVSADEAAGGLFFLQSAGLGVQDSIDALQTSSMMAAMGLGDMETIANGLTTAMTNYGISGAEAGDIVAKAVELGKAAPEEMTKILNQNASTAAAVGMEFSTLATTTAYLTRVTGDANMAGTQMKGILMKLIKPSQMGVKALDSIGLSIEDVGDMINADPFAGMQELDRLFQESGKSSEEWMGKVFEDSRAITGALSILNSDTEGEIADMQKSMSDRSGKVVDGFEVIADTAEFKLRAAVESLKSALIPLGAAMLSVVVPALQKVGEWMGKAIQWVKDFMAESGGLKDQIVETFNRAKEAVQKFWDDTAGVRASIEEGFIIIRDAVIGAFEWLLENKEVVIAALAGWAAYIIGPLVLAFGAWAVSAGLAAVATLLAIAPITLIMIAIGLLVAAFVYAYLKFEWFRNAVDAVWQWIQKGFQALYDFLAPLIQTLVEWIVEMWNKVVTWFAENWDSISETVESVMNFIVEIWNRVLPYILTVWETIWSFVKTTVTVIFTVIMAVIEGAMNIIAGVIEVIMGAIRGDWQQAWDGVKRILSAVWDTFVAIIRGSLTIIWSAIVNTFIMIKAFIGGIMATIAAIWENAWLRFKDVATSAWEGIKGIITGAIGAAMGFVIEQVNKGISGMNTLIRLANKIPGVNLGELKPLAAPGLAHGGMTTAGGLVKVGEKGPEMLNLPKGASVTPLKGKGGGGGGATVHIENMHSGADPYELADALGWELMKRG